MLKITLFTVFLFVVAFSLNAQDSNEFEFATEVVVTGLEVPWDMEFAPDGRLFITERDGRIRVWHNNTLEDAPWAELFVARSAESGLMGLAIDPDFESNGYIYTCYTYFQNEQGLFGNRIVRFRDDDGKGVERATILEGIPGAIYHDGCALDFGPDGKLYISTGDARLEPLAQDPDSLAGKILRVNADGSIPEDNPISGSPVWALGLRNPQGLAWQPVTGILFATEHGTGGVNEINEIRAGGNYGWPEEREGLAHSDYDDPVLTHDGPPAGALFITGDQYPSFTGHLLFVTLGTRDLRRVAFDDQEGPILHRHLVDKFGRLRAITQGPDGSIYVATSNLDTRGNPHEDDDRVIRLLPE